MDGKKKTSTHKITVIVIAVVALTSLISVAAILVAHKINGNAPRRDDPQLVKSQSAYVQYEIRNNAVYLSYNITLKNPSDTEMSGFKINGVFEQDFKSGLILDKNAPAMEKLTRAKTFTIAAGETKTYNIIFVAPYFRNQQTPSGALPCVVLTTADGRETEISKAE